jgi:formylglycine-generating enzyme required for sulfatase activity
MSDIKFFCPECQSKLIVETKAIGMAVACPICSKQIIIPLSDAKPVDLGCNESTQNDIKAGDVLSVELGSCEKMELVWCPPGNFIMGSPVSEANHEQDEVQKQVEISQGFWLGKFEITQEQWERLMGNNPSQFKGVRNPVECVSWDDSQVFIRRLNHMQSDINQGYSYRLPTEAEWEYGCRAGTSQAYAGDLDEMGWYSENSEAHAHPVGQKKGNAWGIFDMHGNMSEWCQDYYIDGFDRDIDPVLLGSDAKRVVRGGCWGFKNSICRSANRYGFVQSAWSTGLGFRVVLAL